MPSAPLSHSIILRPAFHDLDPMQVVWHGHYAKYLELARCALMKRFDYDYPQMRDSGYAWPVVHMQQKFIRSWTYDQQIRATAVIVEYEHRLKVAYTLEDVHTEARLHTAHTVQVAVRLTTQALCYVSPDVLFDRLGKPRPCT